MIFIVGKKKLVYSIIHQKQGEKSDGGEGEREKNVTGIVRRGRRRWRGGDWSRSSRGWGVRRRTGRATRSCQGPIPLPLRIPIPPATSTVSLHSFFVPIWLLCSLRCSFQFSNVCGRERETENSIVLYATSRSFAAHYLDYAQLFTFEIRQNTRFNKCFLMFLSSYFKKYLKNKNRI